MSAALELFVILAAIYLFECAQWVPVGAVGFRALWPGRWRRVDPLRPSANWRRGALFGVPWPPLASALPAEPLPLVIGPAGVCAPDEDREDRGAETHRPWGSLGAVQAADQRLERKGWPLVRTASRRLARELAQLLTELTAASESKRHKRIKRFLRQRFAVDDVATRVKSLSRDTRWVRWIASLLVLDLFVGVPLILWTSLATWWLPILALIVVLWVASGIAFYLALRKLPRELRPGLGYRFVVFASPLSVLRAADLIAREALADLDPLAIGAALLPRRLFAEQARVALVDWTHGPRWVGPLDGSAAAATDEATGDVAAADRRWLAEQMSDHVRRLVQARGLDPARLLAPPDPDDDRCRAYCPRCRAQYTRGDACTNGVCQDMPLIVFDRAVAEGVGS